MEKKEFRILASLSDKTGIITFIGGLQDLFELEVLSTGGTAKTIRDAGIKVQEVSDYIGYPEILDGRVKTLHPIIHGGLLGNLGNPAHVAQMKEQGIKPIHMVVVNLYPFEATVAKPGCTITEAIENIDIGGVALLRAAAKNHLHVIPLCDHRDYPEVLYTLVKEKNLTPKKRLALATKVFRHTAGYDKAISDYLEVKQQGPLY